MSSGTPTCALLFSRQRSRRNRVAPVTGRAFLPGILNGAAKLQSVFVSDSVAPWFWYFTVPVWIAILTIFLPPRGLWPGFHAHSLSIRSTFRMYDNHRDRWHTKAAFRDRMAPA